MCVCFSDMKHFIDEKNGSFKTALHLAVEGKKWNRAETLLGFDAGMCPYSFMLNDCLKVTFIKGYSF